MWKGPLRARSAPASMLVRAAPPKARTGAEASAPLLQWPKQAEPRRRPWRTGALTRMANGRARQVAPNRTGSVTFWRFQTFVRVSRMRSGHTRPDASTVNRRRCCESSPERRGAARRMSSGPRHRARDGDGLHERNGRVVNRRGYCQRCGRSQDLCVHRTEGALAFSGFWVSRQRRGRLTVGSEHQRLRAGAGAYDNLGSAAADGPHSEGVRRRKGAQREHQ